MRELIETICYKYLPTDWIDEDLISEIHFRIDSLPNPEAHIKACVDYIIDMGNGNQTGIDLLINEQDDCNIWNYM